MIEGSAWVAAAAAEYTVFIPQNSLLEVVVFIGGRRELKKEVVMLNRGMRVFNTMISTLDYYYYAYTYSACTPTLVSYDIVQVH